MHFAVGSRNPVKIGCVEEAVRSYWPESKVEGVEVDSQVGAQPNGDAAILSGADNRARRALEAVPAADFGVGVEGGVVDDPGGMWAFAWVVIVDRNGRVGRGKTGQFLLPVEVARMVREGMELGEADDRFFGRVDSKRREGAIGILSRGSVTRLRLYRQGVVFALLPFLHPEHYDPAAAG